MALNESSGSAGEAGRNTELGVNERCQGIYRFCLADAELVILKNTSIWTVPTVRNFQKYFSDLSSESEGDLERMYKLLLNLTKENHANVVVTISELLKDINIDRFFNPSSHDRTMRLFRAACRALCVLGGPAPEIVSGHTTQIVAAILFGSLKSEERLTQAV